MHKTSLYRLPSVLGAALLCCILVNTVSHLASARDNWDKRAARDKADYLFVEAQNASTAGNYNRYYEIMKRAFELDSNDVEIAGEWGEIQLYVNPSMDSATMEQNYLRARRRFVANPRNYYNSAAFASLAEYFNKFDDAMMVWNALEKLYPMRQEPTRELARLYLKNYLVGDTAALAKAMEVYDRLETANGKNVEYTIEKSSAFLAKGDTASVIGELDALYRSAPADGYTNFAIGYTYRMLEMPDSALKYYDNACAIDTTYGAAYMQRAQLYLERGDSVAYDGEIFKALLSTDIEPEDKLSVLEEYVQRMYDDPKRETRLTELFQQLTEMHPSNSQIYNTYGRYLAESGKYEASMEQLSTAIMLDSAYEENYNIYVRVALAASDSTKLLAMCEEATKRFPQNYLYPILASNTYRDMGRRDLALAVVDSVKIGDVNNPKAVSSFLTSKADIHAAAGDTIGALEIYDEAIEINGSNAMAMNNAAYFMTLSGGDLDKAERYSAMSLKGDDLNPTYLDTYAWVFFNKKDYSMARRYIDMALNAFRKTTVEETDIVPDSAPTGDTPAVDVCPADNKDTSVVTSPSPADEFTNEASADIFDHAGDIYFMLGERNTALAFWKRALALDPKNEIIAKKVKHKTIFFK